MKKRVGFYIFLILTVFVMIAIFCFSSQNDQDSSNTSGSVIGNILQSVDENFKSASKEIQAEIIGSYQNIIRKIAHFTIFTALGFCCLGTFYFTEFKRHNKILGAAVVGLIYAFFDEVHQIFVPGRGPALKDVIIDFSGVLFGIIILSGIIFIIKMLFNKQQA